eukprot:scaffold248357_cov90-Cyclotella_meneghiniana.AAC.1
MIWGEGSERRERRLEEEVGVVYVRVKEMVMVEESDRRVFVSGREALKCVGDFKRISLSTLVLCVDRRPKKA